MTDQHTSARFLRVSDAEREHVVELLQRAVGTGLLDIDEFTRRVDTALAARTRGELNVVLLDLPGLTHPDRPAQVPNPAPPPIQRPAPTVSGGGTGPTGDGGGGAEVRSTLGSVTRRGAWDVPAHLVVRTIVGTAELDFTEANIPHDVVDLELDVVGGSVELRLPAGARVDQDGLQATLSEVENRLRGRADGQSGPLFRIRGSVRAGSVHIRPPRRARWWHRS
ncbi:MAG TPA: DUF1707 domain-containing protein [Pseudonocardia sp.]|uniref:DUF1707 SHOCT-like domain-containing protein n=1 Tax=Pseudonocardia sp. TaxID=60912 RepID=UPI002B4B3865|nr:DUF1707 domain-containing protein [Pseudonocardia sp.]HLU60050.1 DUF1707 domain-containing protein [Pseudonocardia sp.]